MRITGGTARGIQLKTPTGTTTRPATDRLRQAIFSSLASIIPGAKILDIFAGTGAYALEALSRGATEACCIDLAPNPIACIKQNFIQVAKSAQLPTDSLEVIRADALTWTPPVGALFDVIFIDPPYDLWPVVAEKLLPRVTPWGSPNALIFLEHPGELPPPLPPNWQPMRTFGKGRHAPVSLMCTFSH